MELLFPLFEENTPLSREDVESLEFAVWCNDSLLALKRLPSNSVDSVVCDPPAGIGFMGADWDKNKGGRDHWIAWLESIMREVFRVLKPGAYGVVWALPRTAHWTAFAIENAGFMIRDQISHLFASGMPKSRNVALDVDKLKGAKPRVVSEWKPTGSARPEQGKKGHGAKATAVEHVERENVVLQRFGPSSEEGRAIEGFGTGLKPAHETWWLFMKPLKTKGEPRGRAGNGKGKEVHKEAHQAANEEGNEAEPKTAKNLAENVLQYGTGILNIDGCRVTSNGHSYVINRFTNGAKPFGGGAGCDFVSVEDSKRWPANIVLSHAEGCTVHDCVDGCSVAELNRQAGPKNQTPKAGHHGALSYRGGNKRHLSPAKSGHIKKASDFFNVFFAEHGPPFVYATKPSQKEKSQGLNGLPLVTVTDGRKKPIDNPRLRGMTERLNPHPTVKSISLMRHFVRLVTPRGGLVLDPFLGSGTTAIACVYEGMRCIGIEKEAKFADVAKLRLEWALLDANAKRSEEGRPPGKKGSKKQEEPPACTERPQEEPQGESKT